MSLLALGSIGRLSKIMTAVGLLSILGGTLYWYRDQIRTSVLNQVERLQLEAERRQQERERKLGKELYDDFIRIQREKEKTQAEADETSELLGDDAEAAVARANEFERRLHKLWLEETSALLPRAVTGDSGGNQAP